MKTKVENEWTFNQPTEEGYYWIEEGIGEFKIVQIKKSLFNKEKLTVTFFESGDHVDPIHMKGTKWLGPITPPPTGTIKEKSLPDVPVPPLPASSKEKVNEKSDS